MSSAGSDVQVIVALYKDSDANAIAAVQDIGTGGSIPKEVPLRHMMVAGTINPISFYVRAGDITAGTVTYNGDAGARLLGGVMVSSIRIVEIEGAS